MQKPFDISKFRKGVTKNIPGISVGFNDPTTWIDTGCYALNYMISEDFFKGIPLEGKFTMLAGESGSGKSFIASANCVRYCQEHDIFPILIDTENGLDDSWLTSLGVDTEEGYDKVTGETNKKEPKIMRIAASKVDDIAKILSEVIENYKEQHDGKPRNEKPKMLFVIDSLGMAITPTEVDQFDKGDMKGDLGRKAKQMTALIRTSMSKIAAENIGIIATNHTYASQDMFKPDAVIAGGQGIVYASSVIISMEQRKLKEDEEGNKTTEVQGIRSAVHVRKSRYAKPFEKVEIRIPYETGMSPYSGLFDLFEKKKILASNGSKYSYKSLLNGTEVFNKKKKEIKNEDLDLIMEQFMIAKKQGQLVEQETSESFIDETDPETFINKSKESQDSDQE